MIAFRLDKKSPVPFYRQIADMVLAGVSSGRIAPGEKLPTIRELAVALEINPNTVAKAYSYLQMLGALDSQQGTGVFAQPLRPSSASQEERQRVLEALCRDFVGRAQLLSFTIEDLIECLARMKEAYRRDAGTGEKGEEHGRSSDPVA